MKKNNTIEDELDAIRIEFYEAAKGMTTAERNEYLRQQVKPVYEEFGLKPISRTPQRSLKTNPHNSDL
ncbi:MAG: hypothetical protein LBP22_08155 [Deltaproteobacteria bacterium]|jgi:hypothetical protein|nr:hypothetical protein [Deltaproteobacteria bacterium]